MEPISRPELSMSVWIRIRSRGSISNRSGLGRAFLARYTWTAAPSWVDATPRHSVGRSSRACATISSTRSGLIRASGELPPHRRVDALELVDRLRPQAGRPVLAAVVGNQEDDVALVELIRNAHRHRSDRARRHAGEDALLLEQL